MAMQPTRLVQYQRLAEPLEHLIRIEGIVPFDPATTHLQHCQPQVPRARAFAVATIVAACSFVPVVHATPTDWQIQSPQVVRRVPARAPYTSASNFNLESLLWPAVGAYNPETDNGWMRQPSEPVRVRRLPVAVRTHVVAPVGVGYGYVSWSYPDSLNGRPELGAPRQAVVRVEPLYVPDVTVVAPSLGWSPRYPDAIARTRLSVSAIPSLVAPVYVPDVTDPVPDGAWSGVYPARVHPVAGMHAAQQQVLAWRPKTREDGGEEPEGVFDEKLFPRTSFPSWVARRMPSVSARQFEWVAPLYLADVTTGPVTWGWLPTAPDQIARRVVRPELSSVTVLPIYVVPDLAPPVFPDRIWARAGLVEYLAFAAPHWVPDVTDPAPPLAAWIGSAEIPIRRVRVVPGLGGLWVAPLDPVVTVESVPVVYWVVDEVGRTFAVDAVGRWFLGG